MDHIFDCTNKLFGVKHSFKLPSEPKQDRNKRANYCGQKKESETGTSGSRDGGSFFSKEKRVSNTVKILTAILKFIVDATAMGLVISYSQEKCLKFTLEYLEFIMSNLCQLSCDKLHFKEENFKEAFFCLKSSFTYAAKLLNLIITSSDEDLPPPREARHLANSLLDVVVSIESCLGSGYAARVVAALKPWLPDLILALGSEHLQKGTEEERESESNHCKSSFPPWMSTLAKIEFHELSEVGSDEEESDERVSEPVEFPAFKKLGEMLILLLRGNTNVLDAVGLIFLAGVADSLERKDFEMVLGLLHFVSVKLVRHELGEWEELNLMLKFLHHIHPKIEREAELSSNEEERQMLQSAIMLLEPVWVSYTCANEEDPMEEEFVQ
ncbi:hypothetical protein U1Q18_039121 [Sarracenia purpurea var. burkii]